MIYSKAIPSSPESVHAKIGKDASNSYLEMVLAYSSVAGAFENIWGYLRESTLLFDPYPRVTSLNTGLGSRRPEPYLLLIPFLDINPEGGLLLQLVPMFLKRISELLRRLPKSGI